MILMVLIHIMMYIWFGTVNDTYFEQQEQIMEQEVPEITLSEFRSKNHTYCDTFNNEIIDIYGMGDTCSVDPIWLYLDDDLKANGFELVHSGRGNWQSGYRLVNLTFKKDDCECLISKKHWYPDSVKSNEVVVTEQISCNHKGAGNFYLGD